MNTIYVIKVYCHKVQNTNVRNIVAKLSFYNERVLGFTLYNTVDDRTKEDIKKIRLSWAW